MASSAKQRKIEELLEKSGNALARSRWFEAERLALKGLSMARQDNQFELMASLVEPLLQARQRRFRRAIDVGRITVVATAVTEDMKIKPGCYLVQPPQVGADARRLRLAALAAEIPVAVLCREPLTRLKQIPVVAISPGSTIRTRFECPDDPERPAMQWFVAALEALGNWAIESLDPSLPPTRRVDAILERLDGLPEHEGLHHALVEACRDAQEAHAAEKSAAAARAANKAKPKPVAADE